MGRFFLLGGGVAIRSPGHPFLNHFLQLAGGSGISLAILTAGSEEAAEANATYWDLFSQLGVAQLVSPKIGTTEEANDPNLAGMLAQCDAVFIAGGAQRKLIERLQNTAVARAMFEVCKRGGLLGGTSAGASLFGSHAILDGGTAEKHLRDNMIEVGDAFNWLACDVMVDTHCSSRGRFPRIIAFLIQQPSCLAVGIDEDSGLLVEDEIATAIGYNSVYFFDASRSKAGICNTTGIVLHSLRDGNRFNLKTRTPI